MKNCGEDPNCRYIDNYGCDDGGDYYVYNQPLLRDETRDEARDCAWVITIRYFIFDSIKNQTLFII